MKKLETNYTKHCNQISDIYEHLPILYKCATKCESIMETGVRGCVSTWALAYGLANNNKTKKYLFLNDIVECDVTELLDAVKDTDIKVEYEWKNSLDLKINTDFDLLFIDTWHIYGQLKRELNKFSNNVKKYIIIHDTTIDGLHGETVRLGWSPEEQSQSSGIPVDEIIKGMWPAIEEFLQENPNWSLYARLHNNNGLTVLKRNYK
jgi:hypothetical protein